MAVNEAVLVRGPELRRPVVGSLVAVLLYAMTSATVDERWTGFSEDAAGSVPVSVSTIAPFSPAEVPQGFSFRSLHAFDTADGAAARALFVGPGTGNHVTYTRFADRAAAASFVRDRIGGPPGHDASGRCNAVSSQCFAAVGPFVVSAGSQPQCHYLSDMGSVERARILLEAGVKHLRQ